MSETVFKVRFPGGTTDRKLSEGLAQRCSKHQRTTPTRASQTQAGFPLPGPAISGRSQVSKITTQDRQRFSGPTA